MNTDLQQHQMSLFERVLNSGPLGMAGASMLVISAALFGAWLVLVLRHRRRHPLLIASATALGIIGYSTYDRDHISLNLSMREAQSVRQDCMQLLQERKTIIQKQKRKPGAALHITREELPASFRRLGAIAAEISPENVQIWITEPTNGWGGSWGFLYDPHQAYASTRWPDEVRPTWYRDFYEYRVRGE